MAISGRFPPDRLKLTKDRKLDEQRAHLATLVSEI